MNKLIEDVTSWFVVLTNGACMAALVLALASGCGPTAVEADPGDVIHDDGSPLTPGEFGSAITSLGFRAPEEVIRATYGAPCYVGEDMNAKLLSYCMQLIGTSYSVVGGANCPVQGVPGGNCFLLVDFTFFKNPALVDKFGTGVAKITTGAQW